MGDFEELMGQNDVESEEFREAIETGMIYLGSFGMNDPLREDIEQSIQLIRYGEILSDANSRVKWLSEFCPVITSKHPNGSPKKQAYEN